MIDAPSLSTVTKVPTAPSILGLKPTIELSEQQKVKLIRLEGYKFPYLQEKLAADDKMSGQLYQQAVIEFKRFLALIIIGVRPLGMISPLIDEVWHQFILFTRQYAKFCAEIFGYFVHHQPRTSHTPLPKGSGKTFVAAYTEFFGELPDIWFLDKDGKRRLSATCDPPRRAEKKSDCGEDTPSGCTEDTPSGWGVPNPPDDCSPTG